MNLDEQLRAALNLEAEMVQTPIPDTRTMIKGGQDRRRRRNAAWAGGGVAAAVILIAGGLYGATQLNDKDNTAPDIAVTPTVTPRVPIETAPPYYVSNGGADIEPGTYRMLVRGGDPEDMIEADLTFGIAGWGASDSPHFENAAEEDGGAGIMSPEQLPGEAEYCNTADNSDWEAASRPAAATSRGLAQQFAQHPSSTVIQPVTATQAFGHDAFHLRLRIHDDCSVIANGKVYFLFGGQGGDVSVSYYERRAVQVTIVDLTVIDVDGTPLVAYYWHHRGVDPALVAEVTSVRDSITFVPPSE